MVSTVLDTEQELDKCLFPPPLPSPPAHCQHPGSWAHVSLSFAASQAFLGAWQRAEHGGHSTNVCSTHLKTPRRGREVATLLVSSPGAGIENRLSLTDKPEKQAICSNFLSYNTRSIKHVPFKQ